MNLLEKARQSSELNLHYDLKSFAKSGRKLIQFLEWVNHPIWAISNCEGVSSKMLNHWEEKKLIPFEGEYEKHTKRKFGQSDFLWFKIIVKLREFGVSLDKIQLLKEDLIKLQNDLIEDKLLTPPEKEFLLKWNQESSPLLDFILFKVFQMYESVILVVDRDGHGSILTDHEYSYMVAQKIYSSHLQLDLKEIVQEMFPKRDLRARASREIEKIDQDIFRTIIMLYKTGSADILIKKKDNNIDRVEITTHEDANALIEVLENKSDFQTIEINTVSGKRKSVKVTEKHKF